MYVESRIRDAISLRNKLINCFFIGTANNSAQMMQVALVTITAIYREVANKTVTMAIASAMVNHARKSALRRIAKTLT